MKFFSNSLFAFIILFAASASPQAGAAKAIPPPPRSYVYDELSTLSPAAKRTLLETLSAEDQKTGNQIIVAIFNSLEGEDEVDYTNRVFRDWNPGKKGENNGLLLATYLKERKIRIEVGYGLEPVVTDAKSKLIIIDYIVPAFKAQKFDEGILNGVNAILHTIHPDQANAGAEQAQPASRSRRSRPLSSLLFAGIFVIFIIFSMISRATGGSGFHRRRGFGGGWTSGGGGFGGFGGGGGGFGGFSGGGGMSGGGGSSGSW